MHYRNYYCLGGRHLVKYLLDLQHPRHLKERSILTTLNQLSNRSEAHLFQALKGLRLQPRSLPEGEQLEELTKLYRGELPMTPQACLERIQQRYRQKS